MNLFKSLVESKTNTVWNSEGKGQIYLMKIQHLRGKNKTLYDTFYKIGYSGYKDLASRIAYLPSCYSVEVLYTAIYDRAEARRIENLIHRSLSRYSYKPRHKKWAGVTESYSLSLMSVYPDLNSIIESVLKPKPIVSNPYSLN
jgi:hypothetical protein